MICRGTFTDESQRVTDVEEESGGYKAVEKTGMASNAGPVWRVRLGVLLAVLR